MKLSNFSNFTRIIILDDNQNDGNGIKTALESVNLPSLFYDTPKIRQINSIPSKNIRLVFLDLMFDDVATTEPVPNAVNALSKLGKVIGESGFYLLVVWSSHTTEDVAIEFEQRLEQQNDFAKPYCVLILQKTEFLKTNGDYKISSIITEMNRQLKFLPALQVLSIWEILATNAVSELSGTVASQRDNSELSKVINSLAEAYGGQSKDKDIPPNALLAFSDVFRGVLTKEIMQNDFGDLYKTLAQGQLSATKKAELNNSLMFVPDTSIGPGSILKLTLGKKQRNKLITSIISQNEATLGSVYSQIIPIAVDVTPLCNAAQKSGKNRYFLYGVLHPKDYTNQSGNNAAIKIQKDYCYSLDKPFWDYQYNNISCLSFNLKLFQSELPHRNSSLGMKLRDNLVIDLQHKVASYISRPGHVLL